MSKHKIYRKALNCKVDINICDKFNGFCNETGLSKSVTVEHNLKHFDAQPYAENGTLEQELDKLFLKQNNEKNN